MKSTEIIRRQHVRLVLVAALLCRTTAAQTQTVPTVQPKTSQDAVEVEQEPIVAKADNSSNPVLQPEVVRRNQSASERLRQHLMASYDNQAMPIDEHSSSHVKVQLGMALIHLDIDEMSSVITVDSWLRLHWKDENLKWNPDDYGGLKSIHFGSDELWRPDIMLYNNAGDLGHDSYGKTPFLVHNTGEVLWVPPAKNQAFCKLDLRYWPMDKQTCHLKFGSWTAHGGQINVVLYNNSTEIEKLALYTQHREWNVVSMSAERKSTKYACCEEDYPDVTFTFVVQRDSNSYRSLIILPCLVLMLVTGCSFLLTPDSGEKLIVSGVALLGTLMYLLYFANTLPFHQRSVPLLVTFYSNTAGLIGIAILLNVICLSMTREKKYTMPPKALKNFFAGLPGKLLCLGNYTHQVSSTHERLTVELADMAESDQQQTTQGSSVHHYSEGEFRNGVRQNGDGQSSYSTTTMSRPQLEDGSIYMRDWTLVAAGLERMFFVIYAISFCIVTSVYA